MRNKREGENEMSWAGATHNRSRRWARTDWLTGLPTQQCGTQVTQLKLSNIKKYNIRVKRSC